MTERYTYSYDAWGRPLMVTHKLDVLSPVVLHDYVYDAVVAASAASVAKPSFHGYSMSFRA